MKSWLEKKNDIETYSTQNEGKYVIVLLLKNLLEP